MKKRLWNRNKFAVHFRKIKRIVEKRQKRSKQKALLVTAKRQMFANDIDTRMDERE